MGGDHGGKWTERPLLMPEFTPPPPNQIVVSGAQLVKVFDPPGAKRVDGGRFAVIVAWAPLPKRRPEDRRQWGVLLAWARHWAYTAPPHQTERAYFSWCLLDEDRVERQPAPATLDDGAAWHGWAEDGELNRAIREAAATLPEHLRDAAIQPAEANRDKPSEA